MYIVRHSVSINISWWFSCWTAWCLIARWSLVFFVNRGFHFLPGVQGRKESYSPFCFVLFSFLPSSSSSSSSPSRSAPCHKECTSVKCFDLCGRFCQYSDPTSCLFNQPSHTFPLGLADLSQDTKKKHSCTRTHMTGKSVWIIRELHLPQSNGGILRTDVRVAEGLINYFDPVRRWKR